VRLPADLSPPLAAKVAAFTQEKAELKEELRHLIFTPGALLPASRFRVPWSDSPQGHESRFAALDKLAEEIRQELALRPDLPQALSRLALPSFPPSLKHG